MKILVFGAGVLGCNLARNLFRAGKDVTLLARGKWAEEIRKNGLRIKDKFSPPRVGQPDSGCERAAAGRYIRCDFRRHALYAAGFDSGYAACKRDKEHCVRGQQRARKGDFGRAAGEECPVRLRAFGGASGDGPRSVHRPQKNHHRTAFGRTSQ